jgi:uncharacterized protein YdaU (DUF1376 family)
MLMDWDARGMHLHCMCIAWMQTDAYALPDDDAKLMRWLGVNDAEDWHNRLKPQIFSAWKLEGGRWVQSRLKREKIKQLDNSDKRKKAANARWKNDVAPHDAHALQMECSSTSTSTAVKKEKNKQKRKADTDETTATEPGARKRAPAFVKPSASDVEAYCRERGNNVNAESFVDYYESNGWRVGKTPMKDWRAAVRTWERRDAENQRANQGRKSAGQNAADFHDDLKRIAKQSADELGNRFVREATGAVRLSVVSTVDDD